MNDTLLDWDYEEVCIRTEKVCCEKNVCMENVHASKKLCERGKMCTRKGVYL